MQLYWDMPGWINLRNRTTCVWIDTLADRIAVCDISSSIAGKLATRWYRVHNSHFRHPRVETMPSRSTNVPETSPVLRRYWPHCPLRQGNDISTGSDDKVWDRRYDASPILLYQVSGQKSSARICALLQGQVRGSAVSGSPV